MSITAKFYTFTKRRNSTKIPSSGSGSSKNIVIKEGSSVLSPSIVLDISNPTDYNYCYIASFGRYYFINDWISDHGRWIADLTVDVLGSWRSSIRSSSQYVLRSSSEWNSYLSDPLYPGTLKKTYSHHDFLNTERCFMTNYAYVIGVMNGTSNAPRLGGVTYYVLTDGQLQTFMNALLGNADYLGKNSGGSWIFPDLFGITKEVMQALVNPTQYIVDSYMLPYDIPYTQSSPFTVGGYTLPGFSGNVDAVSVQNQRYRNEFYTQDVTLEYHPQFATRGSYLKGEPFTHMTLYAGPFGEIQLDTNMLVYGDTAITMKVSGDYLGNCELMVVGKNSGCLLARRSAIVKVPFQIGQMFQDRIEMAKNVIQQGSGGLAGGVGLLQGDVSGTASFGTAVLDSFKTSMPKLSVTGSTGSLFEVLRNWRLDYEFTEVIDEDLAQTGRPLCAIKTLSDLSGYCTILDPDIEFSCYDSEYQQIASFMSGGFFLE